MKLENAKLLNWIQANGFQLLPLNEDKACMVKNWPTMRHKYELMEIAEGPRWGVRLDGLMMVVDVDFHKLNGYADLERFGLQDYDCYEEKLIDGKPAGRHYFFKNVLDVGRVVRLNGTGIDVYTNKTQIRIAADEYEGAIPAFETISRYGLQNPPEKLIAALLPLMSKNHQKPMEPDKKAQERYKTPMDYLKAMATRFPYDDDPDPRAWLRRRFRYMVLVLEFDEDECRELLTDFDSKTLDYQSTSERGFDSAFERL